MNAHKPDVVTRQIDGRWLSLCLNCQEHSPPSLLRINAEQWRRDHTKAALAGEGRVS